MINAAQFVVDFPEFADPATFPASGIDYWLNIASLLLRVDAWGGSAADPWPAPQTDPPTKLALYDHGCELFVAHNLAIEAQQQKTAAGGGIPGVAGGIVQSKSVDKVAISYDTNSGLELNGGHWNLTVYGTRFLRLAKIRGMRVVQLGTGPSCGGGAWYGPIVTPPW